ncbi:MULTISPECIES: asparagine synthase (glutamine-hydrolyzing) [unclassified Carboxylicivirga]|uniref:asparagine synthase (glutamine-hydrolyzing) n=1 Tax=Carboxylicivirga TaxID=1628153 RepID=UPI003D35873D
MCGIVGFTNYKGEAVQHERLLNTMLTRIQHRGPDETGLYISPQCGMGNVRLSIVDLGSGQQPLCNQEGSLWIAYNGEVYNHPELRDELRKKGHRFRTNCDTEVVLHMYEEYGADCLQALNGQFAFAIWDERKKILFLARDRFGIRPLYYTQQGDELIFASEIKCLLSHPNVARSINYAALKESFVHWAPQSPNTFFEGIYELPPGHYLSFDQGSITKASYWQYSLGHQGFKGTVNEAAEELRSLLKSSISLRLRADVQVAAYLSGGLDSSVTTALVKEIDPSVLNTFSICFEDAQYDESAYQNKVASFLKTRHEHVTCTNEDIANWLPQAVYHAEAPILRTAPIPMMLLSGLVRRQGIKVVLTGEGADELLGGYNIFKETLIRHFWARQPQSVIRPLLLKKLYPYIPQLANASPMMLKLFFAYRLGETQSPVYSHLLRWKNGTQLTKLLHPSLLETLDGYNPVEKMAEQLEGEFQNYTALEKAQAIESRLFMSGYLLSSQGDRMAMANSVEGRYPFLDHRVAEFCASLPDNFKLKGLNEKYVLKQMMAQQLPEAVLKRSKQAYRAPIAQALLRNKVLIDEYLNPDSIRAAQLFNPQKVGALLIRISQSRDVAEQDNMALMAVLSTQILHDKYIADFKPSDEGSVLRGIVRNKEKVTY